MVAFINTILSYLVVVVVMAAVALAGGFIGVKLRKNKNAKEAVVATQAIDSEE